MKLFLSYTSNEKKKLNFGKAKIIWKLDSYAIIALLNYFLKQTLIVQSFPWEIVEDNAIFKLYSFHFISHPSLFIWLATFRKFNM